MGYRSDVRIELEKKAFDEMNEAFRELRRQHKEDEIYLPAVRSSISGTKIIEWDSIKWYEGFPEVDTVEKVLRKLSDEHEEEKGWSYCLIRLGEDNSDIEERTNNICFSPNIYVYREICAEYSGNDNGDYSYPTLGD